MNVYEINIPFTIAATDPDLAIDALNEFLVGGIKSYICEADAASGMHGVLDMQSWSEPEVLRRLVATAFEPTTAIREALNEMIFLAQQRLQMARETNNVSDILTCSVAISGLEAQKLLWEK